MLAWISNTIPRPAAKKAAAIAMVNAMGNIGSIPGSYIWRAEYHRKSTHLHHHFSLIQITDNV
jgi:hypothetical protein